MTKIPNSKLTFFLMVAFILLPCLSRGAVLYLEPSEGIYYQDDTFIVSALVDTEGECINAVEASIKFPSDLLMAIDFSQGGSLLTLWPQKPEIDQKAGIVSFAGGVPGGFCGELPGEMGEVNLLGRIIFKLKENPLADYSTTAEIDFSEDAQILLNDGLGTAAPVTSKSATLTILSEKSKSPVGEWQALTEKDILPPEPFIIEVQQNPLMFEGRYFIVFSTTDKQTGIDYYEVIETRDKRQETRDPEGEPAAPYGAGKRQETREEWQRAESPYVLQDQSLKSIIKVRAVDKAGNERLVLYVPLVPAERTKMWLWWIVITVVALVIVILLVKNVKAQMSNVKSMSND